MDQVEAQIRRVIVHNAVSFFPHLILYSYVKFEVKL